jgi:hypothetical protein
LTARPNPYVSNTTAWVDEATSSYHSLNVSVTKRVTRGLSFKANYSFSKVIDLNSAILAPSGENEPADVFSPSHLFLNRGVAAYNIQHQFNANYSYQLPFGNGQRFGGSASGLKEKLIGGWQWNGIVTAQGGFPITPLIGSNNSGTGDSDPSDVPNWNPNFRGNVILGNPNQWFNPQAFSMPIPGTFGNVSRGSLRGPGLVGVDTSIFKRVRMTETVNLQIRAEAFNLFNHSNFAYPNQIVFSGNATYNSTTGIWTAPYSSSAAQVTSTATTSRQIQLAVKVIF